MASPYQVHDNELRGFIARIQPSGVVSYLVLARMKNGKRVRITLGQHPRLTVQQARETAREKLGDILKGVDPTEKTRADKATLGLFLENKFRPWAEVNSRHGDATIKRVSSVFSEFIQFSLSRLNAWIIEKWRTERLRDGKKISTINRDITALRTVLRLAVLQKTLATNPVASVKARRVDSSPIVRYLSHEEELRLRIALEEREAELCGKRANANSWRAERTYKLLPELAALPFADYLKPMVVLTLNTGLRRGELFGLQWESVDFRNESIAITADTTKNGRTRHIPLNEESRNAEKMA